MRGECSTREVGPELPGHHGAVGEVQPVPGNQQPITEFVGVVWIPVDQVVRAIRAGLIDDAKTVEGVLAAQAYGLL